MVSGIDLCKEDFKTTKIRIFFKLSIVLQEDFCLKNADEFIKVMERELKPEEKVILAKKLTEYLNANKERFSNSHGNIVGFQKKILEWSTIVIEQDENH